MMADFDECAAGVDECDQACQNIIGSYLCSCNSTGYTLNPDRRRCDGMELILVIIVLHYDGVL